MLFHIVPREEWEAARATGRYAPASLAGEGFVHLSTEAQWPRTAARFFRGRTDLVLLSIDPSALDAEVRFEPADGDSFPHLYGALRVEAVRQAHALTLDEDGVPMCTNVRNTPRSR